MFLRRGAGEVIGRINCGMCSKTDSPAIDGRAPNVVPGNAFRGTRLTGESGDDDGEGSESEDESVQDTVVVGDESADSEACVDALSRCCWFAAREGGCSNVEGLEPNFGLQAESKPIILASTTVTVS